MGLRPNKALEYLIFWLLRLGLYDVEREKGRREEEGKGGREEEGEGGREEEEDPGLELWFGTSLLFGTLVFVNMEPICMDLLVRKPS